jgi:hypothetical protein
MHGKENGNVLVKTSNPPNQPIPIPSEVLDLQLHKKRNLPMKKSKSKFVKP